jgi:UDP-N-acetylglucosamine--N-acetylmuramyl-(pentapeptide) pyrophosphoryl-undecaprenol N-acetylglucosamine transferase
VVGFGGFVATPAYLAARRRRIPIVVHEANARPGLANRLGARLTPWVATTFPGTRLPHAVRTGLPLRREITTLDRAGARARARAALGLEPERPTLLVVGGSLGAARLNTVLPQVATDLAGAGIQVLHAAGAGKAFASPARPDGPPYVVTAYLDRIDQAYAAADLVLARAGAGTVSELTAVGLPGVYVPLPVGNGEQRLNATPVVTAGGGLLVEDTALTPERVRACVLPLLADPDRLTAMGAAAASFGRPDADERLADLTEKAAGSGRSR